VVVVIADTIDDRKPMTHCNAMNVNACQTPVLPSCTWTAGVSTKMGVSAMDTGRNMSIISVDHP